MAVVVSSANMELDLVLQCVERALVLDDRVSRFTVQLADWPGDMAKLLDLLAREDVRWASEEQMHDVSSDSTAKPFFTLMHHTDAGIHSDLHCIGAVRVIHDFYSLSMHGNLKCIVSRCKYKLQVIAISACECSMSSCHGERASMQSQLDPQFRLINCQDTKETDLFTNKLPLSLSLCVSPSLSLSLPLSLSVCISLSLSLLPPLLSLSGCWMFVTDGTVIKLSSSKHRSEEIWFTH